MAFDGIVTRALRDQVNETLAGARIEKIYQPDKNELVLVVRNFKDRHKLYLSCASEGCGVYLTEDDFQNPESPSGFCMLLRKHLGGGILREAVQKDWERILEIVIEGRDELGEVTRHRLVCEIMGKHSNIILTDTAVSEAGREVPGKILDSAKRISLDVNRVRQILPGMMYEYPPAQDKIAPDKATESAIADLWASWDEGLKVSERVWDKVVLDTLQGVSPAAARTLVWHLDEERLDLTPANLCRVLQKTGLADGSFLESEQGTGASRPAVYLKDDGSPKEFHILPLHPESEDLEVLDFDGISAAAAYYFSHRLQSNRIRQKSQDLQKHLASLIKKDQLKLKRLGEDLLDAQNSEQYRLYGELLNANLHAFATGDKEVTVTSYYDGSDVTIPLDVRYAPAKNAQIYFKKYSKAKNAVKEKQTQMEQTRQDLDYLESSLDLLQRAESMEEIDALRQELVDTGFLRPRKKGTGRKQKDAPAPYQYTTSAGLTVLAGRNNKENDYITLKVAGKNDVWFHTKDIPGSHVILFCKNKEPDDKSIYEAAQIAAWHSKGRTGENIPVDYTKVRYVKKPNGAKPGMVIFTDNHTVYVNPALPERG